MVHTIFISILIKITQVYIILIFIYINIIRYSIISIKPICWKLDFHSILHWCIILIIYIDIIEIINFIHIKIFFVDIETIHYIIFINLVTINMRIRAII